MKSSKKKTKRTRSKKSLVLVAALFVAAAALLLFSAAGGTYAALTYYSGNYHAEIGVYDIGVTLLENDLPVSWRNYSGKDDQWEEDSSDLLTNMLKEGEELALGKTYAEKLSAQNSGSIDEYVRVRVFKYWEDANGKKLTNLDPANIELELYGSGWMENEAERTEERTVLYYKDILPAGDTTPAFCHSVKIKTAVCNQVTETTYVDSEGYKVIETVYHYDGAKFVVKAQVDAVQTHNAQDAFLSAWGVVAEFDENGTVLSVN